MFNLIVFIKDTNALEVDEFFQGQHGKLTAKMRAGAADLSIPACTGSKKAVLEVLDLDLVLEQALELPDQKLPAARQ